MTELPPAPEPLPQTVIDAHTHLTSTAERIQRPVADILADAAAVGVNAVVDVGCDVQSSVEAVELAQTFPNVIANVAIHPNDAARLGAGLEAGLSELEKLAVSSERVRGIGETGLDYYRTTDPDAQARQRHAFAWHIDLAKRLGLPLVVHDRDAHADILALLDAEIPPGKVMMHCFSGDADFARACLERGFWLSFPGTVTFKANNALREALAIAPADRILVETDAPYLTPMPHRGKPNGPYLIPCTLRFMAEQRGQDLSEFCEQLTANAVALFGEW